MVFSENRLPLFGIMLEENFPRVKAQSVGESTATTQASRIAADFKFLPYSISLKCVGNLQF
jgi:hypothetical protein